MHCEKLKKKIRSFAWQLSEFNQMTGLVLCWFTSPLAHWFKFCANSYLLLKGALEENVRCMHIAKKQSERKWKLPYHLLILMTCQNREVGVCNSDTQWSADVCVSIHQSTSEERKYLALYIVSALILQLTLLLNKMLTWYSTRSQNFSIYLRTYLTNNFLCSFVRDSNIYAAPNHVKDYFTVMICHFWVLKTAWMQAKTLTYLAMYQEASPTIKAGSLFCIGSNSNTIIT